MSIMKYILFALLLFGLWVTEPMWRHTDTATSASPVNEHIVEQKKTTTEEVSAETRFLKKLELKFGSRPSVKENTGVPSSVYTYWRKTLQYPDSLQDETCSPIRGSEEGWTTVCRYRTKKSFDTLELREDRFLIKNGTVYKK
ncbi:hypothetical protein TSL6_05330 [Sulfurovum sp. TSL6]|uniref:hypothetical protein n=1 Tax=Sulfurovum sp. TSL6 TaxID=2826995 RepID=UPI001CC7EAC1|nr:hypothetical protein [Sulfurovum sp. TSL6]GIU00027.1 hypothetical protein TSL6_05330 [Sulfurovum sp. TSL6]